MARQGRRIQGKLECCFALFSSSSSTTLSTSITDTDDTYPSILTYSDGTISTDTDLTMDSSFLIDSSIANSTCIFNSTLSTSLTSIMMSCLILI